MRINKYRAKKVINKFGKFDSNEEFKRFLYLKQLEDRGIIFHLVRQPKFEIIPKLTKEKRIELKTKFKVVTVTEEKAVHYTPDFQYEDQQGRTIIEEVKSKGTVLARDYHIRRKLLKHKLSIWNHQAGFEKFVFNELICG